MKKQLPTNTITNELTGASVFFQPQTPPSPTTPPTESPLPAPSNHHSPSQPVIERETRKDKQLADQPSTEHQDQPSIAQGIATSEKDDTVTPRYHDTKRELTTPSSLPLSTPVNNHAIEPARHRATMISTRIERVRKAVKHLGKEAATHRFTPEEKRALAEVVFAYARRGCKTSENELTRIAINLLMLDYQEQGEYSVLAQVVRALNE